MHEEDFVVMNYLVYTVPLAVIVVFGLYGYLTKQKKGENKEEKDQNRGDHQLPYLPELEQKLKKRSGAGHAGME